MHRVVNLFPVPSSVRVDDNDGAYMVDFDFTMKELGVDLEHRCEVSISPKTLPIRVEVSLLYDDARDDDMGDQDASRWEDLALARGIWAAPPTPQLTVYVSFEHNTRLVAYPWSAEVVFPNNNKNHNNNKRGDEDTAACRPFEWSEASGRIWLGLHNAVDTTTSSSSNIMHHHHVKGVRLRCRVGGCPVAPHADMRQAWRIAQLPSCSIPDMVALRRWMDDRVLGLSLGDVSLVDDVGLTPLEHAVASLGDPRVITELLRLKKFFGDVNRLREKGTDRDLVMQIVARDDVHVPGSHQQNAALTVLRAVLARQWDLDLENVDADGNTALHLAARRHAVESELVPYLVAMGASSRTRNRCGRTPMQEAREDTYALLPLDLDDLEKHLGVDDDEVGAAVTAQTITEDENTPSRTLHSMTRHRPDFSKVLERRTKNIDYLASGDRRVVAALAPSPVDLTLTQYARITPSGSEYVLNDRIRDMFEQLDAHHRRGYLTETQCREYVCDVDAAFGVVRSPQEIDAMLKEVTRFGASSTTTIPSGGVTLQGFAVLALKLNAL
eukprot:PhM_4_TR15093/c0_g1_i1/m.71814